MNREEWLSELARMLRPSFEGAGFPLPTKIRASCSWPSKSALAVKKRRIGEAWSAKCSADDSYEVFISPLLADPVEVGHVLVHELCHCAVGLECKHRQPFLACARAMGLTGKMTATTAGEILKAALLGFIDDLGLYPHAELKHSNAPLKQGIRMLKVFCPACGYTVRTTRKWLNVGITTCPCGTIMVEENTA